VADPTQAFDLGAPADPPCLFLHGFTGSPSELRPLAERIAREGLRVVAPRLPGHGLGAADLASAGARDWLEATTTALLDLGQPAHVVALSMGALLAVRLAAEQPDRVRSLGLLAPAVRLVGLGRASAWTLWRLPWLYRRWPTVPWPTESDVRDPGMLGINPKNPRLSLFGMAELRRLQAGVLRDAARVRAPTLVILGRLDRTVSNRAARRLARALSAEVIEEAHSGHQLGLDRDRESVAEALLGHFARVASATPAQGPALPVTPALP
jgi:carboxylesterase